MTSLESITAKDIIEEDPQFKIVYIDEDATVADALEKLRTSKIISLPVRSSKNNLVGLLDMMEEFSEKKVKDLLNISGRNNFCVVDYNAPLAVISSYLSKANFHRVIVLNEAKDVVGIISQSKLVQWLYNKRELLGDKLNIKAKDIARSPVECIEMHKFVIDAFKKIWDAQVTGIAVVDDQV